MADIVDKATRSRMMAGIRGGDTKPERELRSALHALGLRYRIHGKGVVGRPDLVFPKFRAVVFVHGCFWHRHEGCRYTTTPSTRPDFWQRKFAGNVARDERVLDELARTGWRAATIWECALRRPEQVVAAASQVRIWLQSEIRLLELGSENIASGAARKG